ncbi:MULTISPECIES: chaplin [Streptomyces]|uniref:Chaplin n=1 Tax=Streptomyces silvisoli TaxID=3034235 RepID=A0ABT5ZUU1_9ACTN|nr:MULTISPECIES: chaplin [Streptomyces]MDF3293594.1 chaplin [Streptomyces silvisoli]
MFNLKKAAAVSALAGGIALVGAGAASACCPQAHGEAVKSPGVLSGNLVQVPVKVPVNVNGDTINVVGIGNSAFDNHSVNE